MNYIYHFVIHSVHSIYIIFDNFVVEPKLHFILHNILGWNIQFFEYSHFQIFKAFLCIFKYSRPFCGLDSNKFAKGWPLSASVLYWKRSQNIQEHKLSRKWSFLTFGKLLVEHQQTTPIVSLRTVSWFAQNILQKKKNYFEKNRFNFWQSFSRTSLGNAADHHKPLHKQICTNLTFKKNGSFYLQNPQKTNLFRYLF